MFFGGQKNKLLWLVTAESNAGAAALKLATYIKQFGSKGKEYAESHKSNNIFADDSAWYLGKRSLPASIESDLWSEPWYESWSEKKRDANPVNAVKPVVDLGKGHSNSVIITLPQIVFMLRPLSS